MIEIYEKNFSDEDDDDDGDLDDNLDWLIEAAEESDTKNLETHDDSNYNELNIGKQDDYDEEEFIATDDDSDDDDFEDILTEEERNLLRHNTMMNDPADSGIYDMRLRIIKANQDLALEKVPVEGEREIKVGFKAKLVETSSLSDLSASKSDDDYEDDINTKIDELDLTADNDVKVENPVEIKSEEENLETENMIVERGGKFEYVQANEMTGELSVNEVALNGEASGDKKILPPIKERPKSAPTRSSRTSLPRRPMSAAAPSNYNRRKNLGKTFTYSEDQKRKIKEKANFKAKQEQEEKRRKQEEERRAREEADEVWKDWVERKNIELKDKKRQEEEQNRSREEMSDRNPTEAEEAFEAWLKQKADQAKKDRILLRQQQIEMNEGCYIRERRECDHAFRSWLRQKKELARKKRQQDERIRRSAARELKRTKKAQKLMNSLQESQRMKYVDYYGYRL